MEWLNSHSSGRIGSDQFEMAHAQATYENTPKELVNVTIEIPQKQAQAQMLTLTSFFEV